MDEKTDNNITSFKLNILPQFPKSIKLDLQSNTANNANQVSEKEDVESQEIIELLIRNNDNNNDDCVDNNKIIFQLGSSITKKKSVEAVPNNRKDTSVEKHKSPYILNENEHFSPECSNNKAKIESIYNSLCRIGEENNEIRTKTTISIEKMINELKNYKESLVDYWIELTLTQVKNQNNNQYNSSDSDTVVNEK